MYWWIYGLSAFVLVWLLTMLIFKLKRRSILFWLSSVLPVLSITLVALLIVIIVLLPLIYLGLFLYALFARSAPRLYFGRKIKVFWNQF